MKSKAEFLTVVIAAASAAPALASNIPVAGRSFCTLHYTKVAYGKEVRAVMAHTGVEACADAVDATTDAADRRYIWQGVQDVTLRPAASGDHFQGKVSLQSHGLAYDPCGTRPIVQFWVTFADGTSLIERPTPMRVSAADWTWGDPQKTAPALNRAVTRFLEADDATTVACVTVKAYEEAALDRYTEALVKGGGQ